MLDSGCKFIPSFFISDHLKYDQIRRIKEIREEEKEAEITLKLYEVLEYRDGDLYKQCLDNLPKYRKKRLLNPENQQGATFEMEMKSALRRILFREIIE